MADGPFAVTIPFYANGFRKDDLAELLTASVRHATRYGATRATAYQAQEDRYSFLVVLHFDAKGDWNRYWHSEEMVAARATGGSWFQKPLLYDAHDVLVDETAPHGGTQGAEVSPARAVPS